MREEFRFRDKLFNQPIDPVRAWIFKFISKTQHHPEALVVGSAAVLILVCRHYGVRVADVLEMAGRILNKSLEHNSDPKGHVRATWAYIQNELPPA